MYNNICEKCGWTSGPITERMNTCPVCGKLLTHYALDEQTREADARERKLNLILLLLCIAFFFALFPGSLIAMFFDIWVNYESKFWCWISVIGFTAIIFMFCGSDWKKFAILDVVLIVIFAILALSIEDFSPFSWEWNHLFLGKI